MYVTPQQMRELERLTFKAGISYAEMMENAGKALAEFVIKNYHAVNKILLIAGNGNNGGDCYVAAYYLKAEGKTVQILTPLGEPKTEISKQARNRAEQAEIKIVSEPDNFLKEAELVIDGIFGTGFRGELPEEIYKLLKPREHQIRIACDIPSGGNGATGQVSKGTFQADAVVTFGAEKFGMSQYPLKNYCGKVYVADIGIPPEAFQEIQPVEALTLEEMKKLLPKREPDAYKNQMGHILAVAGSVRMRGACILSCMAAMRTGAGLLTCASAEPALNALACQMPEIMCLPLKTDENGFFLNMENHEILRQALKNKQALLTGCGIGVTEQTKNLLKFLISESTCPIILDADGLNCMADCIDLIPKGRTVLTPHAGEAARLLNTTASEIQKDRIAAAHRLAKLTGGVIVLKGAGSIITDGIRTAVCPLGNAGMARAGSGDVLTGMISALIGQGMGLYEAACAGTVLHAAAGDKTAKQLPERYMLPQDLISSLQEIL